ncbi:unnamed protein product [Gadus morhua 'NCC']
MTILAPCRDLNLSLSEFSASLPRRARVTRHNPVKAERPQGHRCHRSRGPVGGAPAPDHASTSQLPSGCLGVDSEMDEEDQMDGRSFHFKSDY